MNKVENKENLQEKFDYIINLVETAGINLESITESILTTFATKTEFTTKEYFKIAKKPNNKKKTIDFIKNKIQPFWINYVENSDKAVIDLRNHLDKELFYTYLSGLYISIHSKKLQDNIRFLVKSTLAEMFQKVAFKIVESNKENPPR